MRPNNWYKFIVFDHLVKVQKGRCFICLKDFETLLPLEIHHILPVAKGGEINDMDNLAIVHRKCHRRWHARKNRRVNEFFI
jgi:5-methylcytosine-specific restriction endonuclease McrA